MPPTQSVRNNQAVSPQASAAVAAGRKALDTGRYEDAVRCFRKAAILAPRQSGVHFALGMACIKAERPAEAIAPLRCARDMIPTDFDYQLALADAYYLAREGAHALPEYLRAGALRPDAAIAWSNAGALFRERGHPQLALEALHRALSVDPTHASALCNTALAFHDMGEFGAARDSVELALQSRPDYPEALWNRALLDLLQGDFKRGWPGHEFRTVQLAKTGGLRTFTQPRWDGTQFEGKRLLVWPEQGVGDQLQFLRFVPRVKALGGTVVLGCSAGLVSLLRKNCPAADEIVVIGERFAQVDLQLPLMSVPHVLALGGSLDAGLVPYVHAIGDVRQSLDAVLPARYSGEPARLRVGIVWAGQPKHQNDHNRSFALETVRPLLGIPGVDWFSLQKGDAAEAQLEPFNAGSHPYSHPRIVPIGPLLSNFDDTAHVLSRLDVVISVDTSVAHLAGAMGVPLWLLVPFVPDWRWQVNRTDSPWYPSARLFRQPEHGGWMHVITEVAQALELASRASTGAPVSSGAAS